MNPATVETLMTAKVISVEPDCPISDLVGKLHAYRISCVVVCQDEVPMGVITERDVVGFAFTLLSGREESREVAADLMSPSVTTLSIDASLDDAVELANRERIRHLPVVDADQRLVGLLTQTDLLRALLARMGGPATSSG